MRRQSPQSWSRRRFLHASFAAATAGAASAQLTCSESSLASAPPNLLVLVSDDQRADSLGFAGNALAATPALDALAARSTIFENAFVTTSVCAVSRASLFSGQYMHRHGVEHFGADFGAMALAQTYPLLLAQAGYQTGFLGKWGVGRRLPSDAFDCFEGFSHGDPYFAERGGRRRHLSGWLAERAEAFVRERDPRVPFCLIVSFQAPHGPRGDYPEAQRSFLENRAIPLPASANREKSRKLPEFLQASLGANGEWLDDPDLLREQIRNYHRLIAGLDAAVAQILRALETHEASGNTVVVFVSDNGMLLGEHGLVGKWLMFEESIRVPLLICDPRVPEARRAKRRSEMALNIDLAPTLLELAGVAIPAGMQGRSLAPFARGESPQWRDDFFYEHTLDPGIGYLPTIEGVRGSRWKYTRYTDARASGYEALFDLRSDAHEMENLAAAATHRARLQALRERCDAYRAELA